MRCVRRFYRPILERKSSRKHAKCRLACPRADFLPRTDWTDRAPSTIPVCIDLPLFVSIRMDAEVCTRCHRTIQFAEQVVVLDGRIVCSHCALEHQPVEMQKRFLPPPAQSAVRRQFRQATKTRSRRKSSRMLRRLFLAAVVLIVIALLVWGVSGLLSEHHILPPPLTRWLRLGR